ncbi:MAG: FkbM family methyltransferase [Gammaproteobacteria bacterium]
MSTSSNALKSFRDSFRRFVPGLFVLGKGLTLIYSKRSFLRTSGYFKSVATKRPCRADGTPIPWMNYGAVSFLEQRLTDDLEVFEYGSGNSTIFIANLVKHITAVECDQGWSDYVKGILPSNANVVFCAKGDAGYVDSIAEQGKPFDVVIVDAEERPRCLVNAADHLTDRGVVILDDAARDEYQAATQTMREKGFRVLPLDGMKAGGIKTYQTTIFYRDGNCLGL